MARKITLGVAAIARGVQERLILGNLDAKRDWGYAPEYVEGMWMMLQRSEPDDYILAAGETHSVREFVTHAFEAASMPLSWDGEGIDEVGLDAHGVIRVAVNPGVHSPGGGRRGNWRLNKGSQPAGLASSTPFKEFVGILVSAELELWSAVIALDHSG